MKAIENQPVPFRPISRRDELEMLDVSIQWLYKAEAEHCSHQWESDDYAGPDSGYMGVTCRVCGTSHGDYLY